MKKNIIYILNLMMILIFASCKDENSFISVDDDNQPCYSILVSAPNNATRAYYEESGENISVKWEKGDVIKIGSNQFVFKNMQGTNGLFFHYGDLTGDKTKATFGISVDGEASQTQSKNNHCREVLEGSVPDNYDFNPGAVNKGVIQLLPAQNMSLLHIQTKSPALFLGGSLLEIKGLDKDYSVLLGEDPSLVFADKGDTLNVYVVVPSDKSLSGTLKFYFYSNEDGYDVKQGDEFHYYMKCNASIKTANREVVKLPLPNKPTHTAIQMGLPSGTKWATMNVGATKESEIGDYFAWGEVETKSSYTDGNSVTVDKTYSYLKGSVLNRFQLAVEYDAATENWGNDWVMPTNAEAKELVNGCTWTSATKDGVSGYSVSRGNKSIFLPATGYMGNTGIANASNAYYWLSSLVNDNYTYLNKVASSLYFEGSGKGVSSGGLRSHGRAIRPILASSRATQEYKWEFEDIEGTLSGVFSVDDNKKVKFSKGNLQYQASTNTWRFAEHQYDIVGLEGNRQISENNAGWIDLFGWGTSGWNSGAKAYQPYSTSTNNSDYYVGNDQNKDLTGTYKNADWGVYNAISNGGNVAGLWRVLTKNEASFLIERKNNNGELLLTKATVNGWPGVLFFPDDFLTSCVEKVQGIQLGYTDDFKTNIITKDFFEYLEFLGVVFLPVTGYREGNNVTELGEEDTYKPNPSIDDVKLTGRYWLSSRSGAKASCVVYKNKIKEADRIVHVSDCERKGANSVRLVHDVK